MRFLHFTRLKGRTHVYAGSGVTWRAFVVMIRGACLFLWGVGECLDGRGRKWVQIWSCLLLLWEIMCDTCIFVLFVTQNSADSMCCYVLYVLYVDEMDLFQVRWHIGFLFCVMGLHIFMVAVVPGFRTNYGFCHFVLTNNGKIGQPHCLSTQIYYIKMMFYQTEVLLRLSQKCWLFCCM